MGGRQGRDKRRKYRERAGEKAGGKGAGKKKVQKRTGAETFFPAALQQGRGVAGRKGGRKTRGK